MGSEWRQFTLGDLCTFLAGSAFAKKYQGGTKGDYPFIKVSDMNLAGNERFINDANNWISESTREKIGAKLHPKNSIAFAKIGVALTYNRRRVLTMSTILDNNMMSAIPNTDVVHSLYFYYLLTTIDFNEVLCGTSLPYLRVDDLKKIEILLPPISEQRAIAHILGSLDDKIELNRRMNKTLEAIARAIFKSWFIDFDPVIDNALRAGNPIPDSMAERAEIRRQMLDENQPSSSSPLSQKAKDRKYRGSFNFSGLVEVSIDEIYGLFPDSFQDSELGAIPRGWEVKTIGSEFRLTMGQSPPGNTYNEIGNGLPFFQGRRDFGFRYPSHRVYCIAPQQLSYKGDTLVSVRAPVGDINMAMERCCIGRGVAGIRHMSNSRSYTYYAMHTLRGQFAKFEAEGTVFGAINKKQFEEIRWISPGENLISKFEKIAFAIDEQIEKNTIEDNTLASLRDTLLPKLISGELRIPDAEKFVEEAKA